MAAPRPWVDTTLRPPIQLHIEMYTSMFLFPQRGPANRAVATEPAMMTPA